MFNSHKTFWQPTLMPKKEEKKEKNNRLLNCMEDQSNHDFSYRNLSDTEDQSARFHLQDEDRRAPHLLHVTPQEDTEHVALRVTDSMLSRNASRQILANAYSTTSQPEDWSSEEGVRVDGRAASRRSIAVDDSTSKQDGHAPQLKPSVTPVMKTALAGSLHGKDLRSFVSIGSIEPIARNSNSIDWSEPATNSDEPDQMSLMDPYYDLTTAKLTKLFSYFLPDKDGMVSYEGFRSGLEAMGIVCANDEQFETFIDKVDEDHSGGISYKEFQQAIQEIKLAQLFNDDFIRDVGYDTCYRKTKPALVGTIEYSPDRIRSVYPIRQLEKFIYSKTPDWAVVRWINVEGYDPLLLRRLSVRYRLHPLAVEDALDIDKERPKYDTYDEHSLLILQTVHAVDSNKLKMYQRMYRASLYTRDGDTTSPFESMTKKELEERLDELDFGQIMTNPEQLSVYMLKTILISVQETTNHTLWSAVKSRLDVSYSKIRQHDTAFLVYTIIDVCVDDLTPIVHTIGAKLIMLDHLLRFEPQTFNISRLQICVKQIKGVKRLCKPLNEVIVQLSEFDNFKGETLRYFRDVQDHVAILDEECMKHLDTCNGLVDAFHNMRAAQQSDVSYILTLVAAIFLPAQFLTGLYGMNFVNMPELRNHYGYYYWWAGVLTIAFLTVAFFHFYKKWL